MQNKNKKSFFEKLTGTINIENDEMTDFAVKETVKKQKITKQPKHIDHASLTASAPIQPPVPPATPQAIEEKEESNDDEGELAVDVYQTDSDIVIQAMIAGVRPDDISVSITRDIVIIKGQRTAPKNITNDNYFFAELYWGSFKRKIHLPEEVDADEAEAFEKHGLLMLRLPKIDGKTTKTLKVQST